MLSDVIKTISESFLEEARQSPQLFSDMASMEKYMAESYSGRVFIELLQNADDCNSKRVFVGETDGALVFANDGFPFSENDVLSICRSGNSAKKRGNTIGYRGIGFKSTTSITDEIIIYSDNTYFSFSKKICADKLNINVDKIPMIRIPIEVDTIPNNISDYVSRLTSDGYNTVFIFKNCKSRLLIDELNEIDSGYFVFLNHIESCEINAFGIRELYFLRRTTNDDGTIISFVGIDNNDWLIIKHDDIAIGFKYDIKNDEIVPCSENEGVYHSFLPTYDKALCQIKINADFSTDPSRKHITIDEKTESAIKSVSSLLSNILIEVLNGNKTKLFRKIFSIIDSNAAFSQVNSLLKKANCNSKLQ